VGTVSISPSGEVFERLLAYGPASGKADVCSAIHAGTGSCQEFVFAYDKREFVYKCGKSRVDGQQWVGNRPALRCTVVWAVVTRGPMATRAEVAGISIWRTHSFPMSLGLGKTPTLFDGCDFQSSGVNEVSISVLDAGVFSRSISTFYVHKITHPLVPFFLRRKFASEGQRWKDLMSRAVRNLVTAYRIILFAEQPSLEITQGCVSCERRYNIRWLRVCCQH